MKIEALHVGMKVKHPQHGVGTVKAISEHTADILFDEGKRTVAPETSELEPAEAHATLSGLDVPLGQIIDQTVSACLRELVNVINSFGAGSSHALYKAPKQKNT